MKIKLINKDKGTSPPSGAFDFRPNRTVDSNPKLSNMKGDYVSPKSKRKRKYYIGGNFTNYASPYKQLQVESFNNKIPIPKIDDPIYLPFLNEDNNEEVNEPVYSTYWNSTSEEQPVNHDLPSSLIDLLEQEGFKFKVTSGFRPNSKTAQGKRSNHSLGNKNNPGAYDIVPLEGTFDEFESRIYSNPRVLAWLDKNGWGSLKENAVRNGQRGFLRTDGTFANTNATGNHFHFGPDSRALEWKEVNRKKYGTS